LAVRDDVSAPHHALGFEAGEKPQHREQAEDEVCGQALLEDNSINHQSGVARRDRRSVIAVANLSGFGESRNAFLNPMWTEADGKVLRAKAWRGDANAQPGFAGVRTSLLWKSRLSKGSSGCGRRAKQGSPDAQERIACEGLRRSSQTLAAPAKLGTI